METLEAGQVPASFFGGASMQISLLRDPDIIYVEFRTQVEMCATLLRMQEFYESPVYAGKVFDWPEYAIWYAKTHGKGQFSYLSDFSGFNLYKSGLSAFVRAYGSRMYDTELDFIQKIQKVANHAADYAVIAVHQADIGATFAHELAHAFYHLDVGYRSNMQALNSMLQPTVRARVEKELATKGYHPKVWQDEIQAFLGEGNSPGGKEYIERVFGVDSWPAAQPHIAYFENYAISQGLYGKLLESRI